MKILVTEEIAEIGINLLRAEHEADVLCGLGSGELVDVIGDYEALVVCGNTRVTKEVLDAGRKLRVIGCAGVDVDLIDVQGATQRGIMVLNSPQGKSAATIEYTFSMLLALSRRMPLMGDEGFGVGTELKDRVLGIVGLGRVGMGVAHRAKAFDMEVLAYDPFIVEENARRAGVELVDFQRLLRESDFISLHIPLTTDSRHTLNHAAFAEMKKGVKIINCARGGLIDEEALIDALENGTVEAAALDDLEVYPPQPEYALRHMDNVICTHRQATATVEGRNEVAANLCRGVLAALRSEPVPTSLNIPPVSECEMETVRPYLALAERMGVLAVHLAEGRLKHFEAKYLGRISSVDTKMLTRALIKGMLNPILQEAVNFVNGPEVAKSRGITYNEVNSKAIEDFADLMVLTVRTDISELRVAGTLFGGEGRIVQINNARVDLSSQGWLLMFSFRDHPGVIGKVGATLGNAGINIYGLQICHSEDGDVNMMMVSTESDVDPDTLDALANIEEAVSVKKVWLDAEQGKIS